MSPTAFDVVGLGENSVDHVYRIEDPVGPDTKLQATAYRASCGGQVATTLATCAALGLRTAYLGAFGGDAHGALASAALAGRGVDVTHAPVRPVPNRHAAILVHARTGHRSIVWHRDPGLALRPEEIPEALIARARLLHVDGVDPGAALHAARIARAAGIPVTCDLDRVTDETRELLGAVSTPILAEPVPGALTGEPDVERALRALRRTHAGWLCVTLGTRGAVLLDGDTLHRSAAPVVAAVDTTGAGDVFRGAFIHALLRGAAPADVLRFAVMAAALSCTRQGAIDSVPTLDEVARFGGTSAR